MDATAWIIKKRLASCSYFQELFFHCVRPGNDCRSFFEEQAIALSILLENLLIVRIESMEMSHQRNASAPARRNQGNRRSRVFSQDHRYAGFLQE